MNGWKRNIEGNYSQSLELEKRSWIDKIILFFSKNQETKFLSLVFLPSREIKLKRKRYPAFIRNLTRELDAQRTHCARQISRLLIVVDVSRPELEGVQTLLPPFPPRPFPSRRTAPRPIPPRGTINPAIRRNRAGWKSFPNRQIRRNFSRIIFNHFSLSFSLAFLETAKLYIQLFLYPFVPCIPRSPFLWINNDYYLIRVMRCREERNRTVDDEVQVASWASLL